MNNDTIRRIGRVSRYAYHEVSALHFRICLRHAPTPMVVNHGVDSSFLRISLILAFSVLSTFTKGSGRITELPGRRVWQNIGWVSFRPDRVRFLRIFRLGCSKFTRDKGRAYLLFLQELSQAFIHAPGDYAHPELLALQRVRLEPDLPFSMRKKVNLSENTLSTTDEPDFLICLCLSFKLQRLLDQDREYRQTLTVV